MRILLVIVVTCLMGIFPVIGQSIFDEETPEPVQNETSQRPENNGEESPEKPVKRKKKKKAKRKKKAGKSAEASSPSRAEYTPEELAKSSYIWAPDTEPVALSSTAPGLRVNPTNAAAKPVSNQASSEIIEGQPAPQQKFRLPEIPLAQVLIVAGFVILFLIYRFRVGKQIKRKKY